MADMIIVIIILVLIIVGSRATKKHLKGQGGCCGGGSKPAPKRNKKLKNTIAKKVAIVEGMTCEHCKNWVEKSINDIEGTACKVNLSKKEAVISMEREISDEEIRKAIEKAGYKVIEIR